MEREQPGTRQARAAARFLAAGILINWVSALKRCAVRTISIVVAG